MRRLKNVHAVRSIPVAIGIACVAMLAAAPGALAADPACGSTVTQNVKLTADLDCSGSGADALDIGRNGLTIDLNGHTITGPGSSYGIRDEGFDHLTVENGTVKGFGYNVFAEYARGTKVTHMHLGSPTTADYADLTLWYSSNVKADHITATSGYSTSNYPLYLYENGGQKITNVRVKGNANTDDGVYDYQSGDAVLDKVKVTGAYDGFYIEEPLASHHGYSITNSTANGNGDDGFYIYENYPTTLYQAMLSHDTANDNGSYGFYADNPTGGKKNHADGNTDGNCHHVRCSH